MSYYEKNREKLLEKAKQKYRMNKKPKEKKTGEEMEKFKKEYWEMKLKTMNIIVLPLKRTNLVRFD